MTIPLAAQGNSSREQELVVAACRGDAAAFEELYERYTQRIYNLVRRSVRDPQLAEDVCQEVWLKAHQELPKLRAPGAFSTWLYRIASRSCVDAARKLASRPPVVELFDDRPDTSAGPEDAALRHDQARLTWEALAALPERQHIALFLREVEERSYREIAQIMETSVSAVETLLFRGRRAVAEAFDRLQATKEERCGQARRSIAGLVDGEATPVQQRAIAAHVEQCQPCLGELTQARGASAAYGALPLLAVPAFLGERVLEALAAAGAVAHAGAAGGGGSAIANLLSLVATKAKLTLTAATLTAGLATVAVVTPQDAPFSPVVPAGGGAEPPAAAVGRDGIESNEPPVGLLDEIDASLLLPGQLIAEGELTTAIVEALADQVSHDLDEAIGVVTDIAGELGLDVPANAEVPVSLPTVELDASDGADTMLPPLIPTVVLEPALP